MRTIVVLAVLLGLSAAPAIAVDPVDWNNIVFEWVTVTVTSCPCSSSSGFPTSSTALSTVAAATPTSMITPTTEPPAPIYTATPTEALESSVTVIPFEATAQILGEAIVASVNTSIPVPTIQSTWARTTDGYNSAPPAPTATLRPAILSNENLADPENLRPQIQHQLYYADNSNAGVDGARMPIANVKFDFTMETVNLESSHIQSVTCSSSGSHTTMNIVFSDSNAYNTALSSWPKDRDFLIIGYFPGCGSYSEGMRTFSKVHETSSNNAAMEVTLLVEDLPLRQAITAGDIKFGSFNAGYTSRPRNQTGVPYYGVGVPAECLGDQTNNFDVDLDNQLGVSNGPASFGARFRAKRSLRRRRNAARFSRAGSTDVAHFIEKRWSIGGFFSDIVDKVKDAVETVVDKVTDAVEAAWDGITGAMKTIGEAIISAGKEIIGAVADFDYIKTTVDFDTFLSKDEKYKKSDQTGSAANTPWGLPGFLLAKAKDSETGLYCVDCGIEGEMYLNGHITFSLKDGLKASTFTMNGTMHARVQLGISGEASLEAKSSVTLFNIPLGPVTIPEIIDIGPQVSVMAEAYAKITSAGRIMAGFDMDFDPYMKLDLVSWTSETSGWVPTLHPVVQLDSELSAAVGVRLPVKFGFGIDLMKGWVNKMIAIEEKAGVSLAIRTAARFRADEEESWAGIDAGLDRPGNFSCPNSAALLLDFTNTIDLNVVDMFVKPLGKARVPLWQKCLSNNGNAATKGAETPTVPDGETATGDEKAPADATPADGAATPEGATEQAAAPEPTVPETTTVDTTPEDAPADNTTAETPSANTTTDEATTATNAETTAEDPETPAPLEKRQLPSESSSSSTTTFGTTTASNGTVVPSTTTPTPTSSETSSSSSSSSSSTSSSSSSSSESSLSESSSSSSTSESTSEVTSESEPTSSSPSNVERVTDDSSTTSSTESTTSPIASSSSAPSSAVTPESSFPTLSTFTVGSTTSISQSTSSSRSAEPTIAPFSTTSRYPTSNSTTSTSSTASATPTAPLNLVKVTLEDANDGLFINTNADGTIYLCNGRCGSPAEFYTQSDIVVADVSERVLHFYGHEMSQYGVSRLRLHAVDKLPNTSVIVGLSEFQPNKIVAVSTESKDFYYIVACRIEGAPTKMFLAKDAKAGVETLKAGNPLVGGKALDCSLKNLRMVKV
ncbi:hypothetical protein TWF696_008863 [Orbilia brochopaga]|uniref:Uncharacterized protein n=1 Tax=Orbilia brochopaga TaxID=3140254 RepID=A0AAV9UH03_9PEZI